MQFVFFQYSFSVHLLEIQAHGACCSVYILHMLEIPEFTQNLLLKGSGHRCLMSETAARLDNTQLDRS